MVAVSDNQPATHPKRHMIQPLEFRYVTENITCHEVASPRVNTLSATLNGRPAIAPANNPTSRYPGCNTAAQQPDAPEHNAGTMPSPSYSPCKLNMPLGAMLCPIAFATLPPPKLCRLSPISISTSSPRLSHLVATGETDAVAASDNQQRQSTNQHTHKTSCQRQSKATIILTKRSHRLHPD
jgi:hypothetical protein